MLLIRDERIVGFLTLAPFQDWILFHCQYLKLSKPDLCRITLPYLKTDDLSEAVDICISWCSYPTKPINHEQFLVGDELMIMQLQYRVSEARMISLFLNEEDVFQTND